MREVVKDAETAKKKKEKRKIDAHDDVEGNGEKEGNGRCGL